MAPSCFAKWFKSAASAKAIQQISPLAVALNMALTVKLKKPLVQRIFLEHMLQAARGSYSAFAKH